MGKTHEIIFVNEFLQDDTDLDLDVFRAVKGCSEVEVGKIHGHELCIWFQAHAIEEQFSCFKQACLHSTIARVCGFVSANGDLHAIGVLLGWSVLTNHFGVGNVLDMIGQDVFELDGP